MNQEEKKYIECAKCHKNAETKPNLSEYTTVYPIRDEDGKIYCWDCYKSISHCKGCGKSVANIKFPRSGQPTYPRCIGGVSYNCERISNKVEFICSKECAKNLADQKYQAWKEKLSQGWTKCEECWKFWMEKILNKGEDWKWLKEERQHSRFIKLVAPNEGKWCKDHKSWEEGGKQRYEEENIQRQKNWEALTYEDKLKEVKKAYRADENLTELASREKIPPLVLHRWQCRDSHKHHNCPDCHFDKEDNSPNANNFSALQVAKQDSSNNANKQLTQILQTIQNLEQRIAELEKSGNNPQQVQVLKQEVKALETQKQTQLTKLDTSIKNEPTNDNSAKTPTNYIPLIVGGLLVISAALAIGYLLRKDKNKK